MPLEVPAEVLAEGNVRVEAEAGVVVVTLDRPEARNAQTPATWAALAAVGDAVARSDTRVVVLRGEGSAFSAGLDRRMFTPEGIPGQASLPAMAAMDDAALESRIAEFQRAFLWQRHVGALTVAAVQGPAVGAGFQLALACDLLLASPSASFAMRETSYGLVPDLAGTGPLVRSIGYARAVEICATGRTVSAEEGYRLGFVTRVVEDLDAAVAELAAAVAGTPPGAVSALLPLLATAEVADRQSQAVHERRAQVERLRALLRGA